MTNRPLFTPLLCLALACIVSACSATHSALDQEPRTAKAQESKSKRTMNIQYLEIVTPDMDATCTAMEKIHNVKFGAPDVDLGMARTAPLHGGWLIGVRAPMHAAENAVVRPYVLVEDIEAAVEGAKAGGGRSLCLQPKCPEAAANSPFSSSVELSTPFGSSSSNASPLVKMLA